MACEGLKDCGQEIMLWVPGSGDVAFESIRSQYGLRCPPFEIRRIPSSPRLKRLDFAFRALKESRENHCDLIYTWTIQIAALAAIFGMRTAFEVHDLPTGGGKRWFNAYTKSKTPKKILFITKALRDKMMALYPGIRPEDCLITPNGFNPADYGELPALSEAKIKMGFPQDRPAVSCSGHLYAGRGSELFLDLASRFPEADFHWFGGFPKEVNACREIAEKRGLTNVQFHGFIPRNQLPLAQAACDILLMPYGKRIAGSGGGNSAEICSPMKLFEYLAVGRCILSSDLPVIHEIIDPTCAVFCAPEDPDDWARNLAAVLASPERRESLSTAAKKRSEQYTWKNREATLLTEEFLNTFR